MVVERTSVDTFPICRDSNWLPLILFFPFAETPGVDGQMPQSRMSSPQNSPRWGRHIYTVRRSGGNFCLSFLYQKIKVFRRSLTNNLLVFQHERSVIAKAMQQYHQKTCIRFSWMEFDYMLWGPGRFSSVHVPSEPSCQCYYNGILIFFFRFRPKTSERAYIHIMKVTETKGVGGKISMGSECLRASGRALFALSAICPQLFPFSALFRLRVIRPSLFLSFLTVSFFFLVLPSSCLMSSFLFLF